MTGGVLIDKVRYTPRGPGAPPSSSPPTSQAADPPQLPHLAPPPATPSAADAQRQRRMEALLHVSALKLSIFMYHPTERAKRFHFRGKLPHAADLRSLFIYRQESSSSAVAADAAVPAATSPNEFPSRGPIPSSSSATSGLTRNGSLRHRSPSSTRGGRSSRRSPSPAPPSPAAIPLERARSLSPGRRKSWRPPAATTTDPSAPPTPPIPSAYAAAAAAASASSPSAYEPSNPWMSTAPFASANPPKPAAKAAGGGSGVAGPAAWLRTLFPRATGAFRDRISPVEESSDWLDGLDWDFEGDAASPSASLDIDSDDESVHEDEMDLGNSLRWRLDELIGKGVVGMVYKAELLPPGGAPAISVAVKHLHLPSANPNLNHRNFEQLVAALSLIEHPHVISYFGSHVVDEDCFLFMEFCDMGTLSDWLKDHGPVRETWRLSAWMYQLALGLQFLHKHGVVHRDLKPSNIMIKNGALKIADFSSAKLHGLCCKKVHDSQMAGTPAYMAPEVVLGAQKTEVTGSQDVWSLGAVMYEAVLGRQPFAEVDNVWSLYFLLGQYAALNVPTAKRSPSKVEKLLSRVRSSRRRSRATTTTADDTPARGRSGTSSSTLAHATPSSLRSISPSTRSVGGASTLGGSTLDVSIPSLDGWTPPATELGGTGEDGDLASQFFNWDMGESVPRSIITESPSSKPDEDELPPLPPTPPPEAQAPPRFPMHPNHHPLLSQLCLVSELDLQVLDAISACLAWDPTARITAARLLNHPAVQDGGRFEAMWVPPPRAEDREE
ncbi:hypothetical protein H9P43_009734 [Blastocladiella emersonii ATCC 22665]|nr:hypothetical protein H9P43_009734 [Blastocladiella emersonii ATCC 22665]